MSVLGLSDLCSFGSHDAVGQLVALITQSCFDPGCGWESQPPLQHRPLCGRSGALFVMSESRQIPKRKEKEDTPRRGYTHPRCACGARGVLEMQVQLVAGTSWGWVDLDLVTQGRNVEVNAKGENPLRGVNSYNSQFCTRVGCSITVVRRLPGLSSGREWWAF